MEVLANPWFYPVALLAVFITGLGKSGFGMAGGLSVPLLALVMSPAQAAAIMLPLLLASDAAAVWAYRGVWDRANMKILVPAGLTGTLIGWATFRYLSDDALRVVLGAISLGFVLNAFLRRGEATARPSRIKGWFWSTISGVTSFIAQAGGPPYFVYMLPQRLDKRLFAGTTVWFFAILNVSKIVPYYTLGLLTPANVTLSAALIPVALVGIFAGVRLQRRMSQELFMRICYTLLFVTGVQLLHEGTTNLLRHA